MIWDVDVPNNAPPAELIFGEWYPALRADALRVGKMSTALLLGVPLVLGRRNDGRVFAMRDLCPHRGIPLSAGWFDGETVQCKYHGWKFEPCCGQCTEIPSLTGFDILQPTKIYRHQLPLRGARRLLLGLSARSRRGPHRRRNCRQFPRCQSSRRSSAPRIWPPTCPAMSITASSA